MEIYCGTHGSPGRPVEWEGPAITLDEPPEGGRPRANSAPDPAAALRLAATRGRNRAADGLRRLRRRSVSPAGDDSLSAAHSSSAFRGLRMRSAGIAPEALRDADRVRNWTPEVETSCRLAWRRAVGYAWMYEQMVAGAKWWGNKLGIATKILGGFVGTQGLIGAILTATSSSDSVPLWVSILSAVIGFAILGLGVLDDTWNVDVVQAQSLVAQVDFGTLARSIRFQYSLPVEARDDARIFVPAALRELEALKLNAPVLWGGVKARYIARCPGNPIYNLEEDWTDDPRPGRVAPVPPEWAGPAGGRGEIEIELADVRDPRDLLRAEGRDPGGALEAWPGRAPRDSAPPSPNARAWTFTASEPPVAAAEKRGPGPRPRDA